MATHLSRRAWLQRSAMAAAVLPVSRWYLPERQDFIPGASQKVSEGVIRLNSNENAYGPSEAARKAIMESLSEANRYPRHFIAPLREAIAKREGLSPDHVFLTAGSTELLGLAGLMFGMQEGELLACHPTFDFLILYAERLGCKWSRTPLDANYQYDLNALDKQTGPDTRLIFICNPNNPTGIEIPNKELRAFCQAQAPRYPVFVDEAYVELSPNGRKSSMVDLVDRYPNIIIGRTFSKVFGLAGLRIGYALANPVTIERLANLHAGRSISVSAASAAAAMACLEDPEFETFSRNKIIEGRDMVSIAFDSWGVGYMPSAANFIYFQNDRFAEDPVTAMQKEKILIRSYSYMPGWTRVSMGTVEEMETFIRAMGRYVK